MNRPATRMEAVVAWRTASLATIEKARLELTALESLVRTGITGPRLDEQVEACWGTAGKLGGITLGPATCAEALAPDTQGRP